MLKSRQTGPQQPQQSNVPGMFPSREDVSRVKENEISHLQQEIDKMRSQAKQINQKDDENSMLRNELKKMIEA